MRYGLYRTLEIIEGATVAVLRAVTLLGGCQTDAGRILGQATEARRAPGEATW